MMTAPARYRVKPIEFDVRPYPDRPVDAPGVAEEIESLRQWCEGRLEWQGAQPVIHVGTFTARPGDYILRSPKSRAFTVVPAAEFAGGFERVQGYR